MSAHLIVPLGERPRTPGERAVVALLVKELPSNGYTVIPNVLIADRSGQRLEYDCIVVAPHAVYAIEIKDWSGPIEGDEREWLVRGQWGPAPISSIEHKAKVLKSTLSNAKPALGRIRVESVVVLAVTPARLELTDGARRSVRLMSEIVKYLSDPAAIGRAPGAIRTLDSMIVNEIVGRRSADQGPLRFGKYEVRETIDQTDAEAWFIAFRPEMPGLPEAVLRVVPDSPYLNTPQERDETRRSMSRELEAAVRAGSHPNVVTVRDVFETDGALVAVLDAVGGISLRRRLATDPALTLDQRQSIILGVALGLQHLHASQVIHRAVAPENILLDERMEPKLTRFGLAKIRQPGLPTVWPENEGPATPYRAPELTADPHGATAAADIYSLGVLAFELFAGHPPFSGPPSARMPPVPKVTPAPVAELLPAMLSMHPRERPTAEEVAKALAPPPAPHEAQASGPKDEYRPGDVIDDAFEVRSLLGRGGFSSVYRVYRALEDCDYALKVFNGAGTFESLQRELKILRGIDHPHVVKVVWGGQTRAGQWYLVSQYVEGESLEGYADGTKSLSAREAVAVIDQLLSALQAIHPNEERLKELELTASVGDVSPEQYDELQEAKRGVVHRDIKPQNLILTGSGVVLIDFNIASIAGSKVATVAGTPRYRPPEADYTTWSVYTDLFATGVVAYELLCHKHPYEHLAPGDDPVPADPRTYRPDLSPSLVEWLVRACAGSRSEHFPTATVMRSALNAVGDPTVVQAPAVITPIDAPPNTNPFVALFLEMGSQARRSNTGTRGLTEIARQTYVTTRLDGELADAIVEGRHRLVVVTGNAGDGKTAFIQRLEEKLVGAGAERVEARPNGGELRLGGRSLVTLYDGSQDEAEKSSDAVLTTFFGRAFDDGATGSVGVIAINEGRLRDFAVGHRADFPDLVPLLAELDQPGAMNDRTIAVVNLNLRSVTVGGESSIFSRQMREVVRGPFWAACQGCDWRAMCPIKHNVSTLADPTSGDMAIERMRRLVDIVRLRRRRHLTLRDVRSLISFVLFRDRDCAEIGGLVSTPARSPFELLDLTYFQAGGGLGAPVWSSTDRGVGLLEEIDVAKVTNPLLDRALTLGQGPRRASFETRDSDLGAALIERAGSALPAGFGGAPEPHRRVHEARRRLAYFERADDGWSDMLPYRRLRQFEEAVRDPGTRERLKLDVITAISYAEGAVEPGEKVGELRLTSGAGGSGIHAFRRFGADEFELRVGQAPEHYVETEPDSLELVHRASGTSLPVDLDLLEVLEQMRHGHVASAEERRGFLLNLSLFKNRLLMEPARELFLEYEGDRFLLVPHAESAILLESLSQ